LVQRLRKHFQNINDHNGKDDNDNQISLEPNSFRHRKNQHSISSIVTNVSQSSSSDVDDDDMSDISCSASQTAEDNRPIMVKSKLSSFISYSKTQTELLWNPFMKTSQSQVNDDNDVDERQTKATIHTKATIVYPLASHLADSNSEKNLIKNLANFILTTLLNDINRGFQNQLSSSQKL
ncbi:hypothetical protein BLA29_003999, partial [Euroglyphus maynei]